MSTFNTDITENNIMAAVRKIASFEGKMEVNDAGPAYAAIRTTEQDAPLLHDFYEDALHRVMQSFAGYVSYTSPNIVLTEPVGFIQELRETIQDEIVRFFECHIAARWFALVLAPKAEEYQSRAAGHIGKAEDLFFRKMKPTYQRL